MADILISGMEMPERCEDCILCHQYETVTVVACGCKVNMRTRELDCVTRPDWCPLIEVPNHSDLISREWLIKNWDKYVYTLTAIESAPAIIPASGKEKT